MRRPGAILSVVVGTRISPVLWLRSAAPLAALATVLLLGGDDAVAARGDAFGGGGLLAVTPAIPSMVKSPQRLAVLYRRQAAPGLPPVNADGSLVGLFHRHGWIGGFAAGFLGAGVLGLLFGKGLFAGLSGIASAFGLTVQIALIVALGRLIWRWWHGGEAVAFADLSPRQLADAYGRPRRDLLPTVGAPVITDLALTASDHDWFDRLFEEIISACERKDVAALRARVTPDLLAKLAPDSVFPVGGNTVTAGSGTALLGSHVAEAWRAGATDYAAVAMRCASADVDAGGHADTSASCPTEVTQVWSFVRRPGQPWLLSSIQQG